MLKARIINNTHRLISRVVILVRLAIKIRNQCNAIISYSVGQSAKPSQNGELLLIKTLAPTASYFIDVGANIGSWSLEFTRLMPGACKGLAFEPSSDTFRCLQQTLSANTSIELVCCAIGETAGSVGFTQSTESSELSHISYTSGEDSRYDSVVRVSTVDEELAVRGWPTVSLLKIDTEGHDYLVLKGAVEALQRKALQVIQFEYNTPWRETASTLRAAISLLQSHHYKVYLLRSSGLHEIAYDCLGEYFSYSNYVAVSPDSVKLVDGIICGRFPS